VQDGDLALFNRPRYLVVLEGVLCRHTPIERERRFRSPEITGYNIHWHEVPLKRLVYMKEHWPDTAQEIISFISQEFVDEAAEFLDDAQIPYDEIRYVRFDKFVATLRFQPHVSAIYDSDQERLEQYGQLGVSTQRGMDF
jgi:hypothetical protein